SSASTAAWPGSPGVPTTRRPPCALLVRSPRGAAVACRAGAPGRSAGRALGGGWSARAARRARPGRRGLGYRSSPDHSLRWSQNATTTRTAGVCRPPDPAAGGSVRPAGPLLCDAVAAVDDEHLAGDVGGPGAGEERDGGSDLVGGAGAPERGRSPFAGLVVGLGAGGDPARCDGVDRDAVRTLVDRQGPRQPEQAGLRGGVGDLTAHRHDT